MGRVGMETKHVFGGFVMYNEWEVEVFCPYELR